MQRELYSHYSISIIPFILYACIESIKDKELSIYKNRDKYYLTIVISLIAIITYGRVGYFFSRYIPRINESLALHEIRGLVGERESVLSHDNYVPFFANRKKINGLSQIRKDDYDYDYYIIPNIKNKILFKGKKNDIKKINVINNIKELYLHIEKNNIKCKENQYIRVCSKDIVSKNQKL